MKKKFFSILTAASLAVIGQSAPSNAQTASEIVIAMSQAPPSYDAQITASARARNVNLHIYETLFARDERGAPVPDLAESVDVSDDGLTYVFQLREGVNFHDGSQLDPEDVVASLTRYQEVGATSGLLDAVDSISATGELEVTVTLNKPQSNFLDNISSPRAPVAIYPSEQAIKGPNEIEFIGTGPFRFVEYQPDAFVRLERFEDYTPNPNYTERDGFAGRKEVFVDSLVFRFMPESGSRIAALLAGDVQFVESIDSTDVDRLNASDDFEVYPLLPYALRVVKFNHAQEPTNDVEFRRAVAAALDMEEIMAITNPGVYDLDGAWVFPNSEFYTESGLDLYNIANLDVAREHLAKSSYNGETLTFIVDSARASVDTATVVQQRLSQIGVKVELSVSDFPTAVEIGTSSSGWNFWTHGMGTEPFEGPATVMGVWVDGASQMADDATIDQLFADFTSAPNLEERKSIFGRFQQHMYDEAVAVTLGGFGQFQGASSRITDFEVYRIPRMWGVHLAQ